MVSKDFIAGIEELYSKGEFQGVIDIAEPHQYSYLQGERDRGIVRLIEIITSSYIELNMLSQAREYIDQHISFLKETSLEDGSNKEDFTFFTEIRRGIFERKNSLLGQFKTLKDYVAHGGNDPELLERKHLIEEDLFLRYVTVNKAFMYIVFGIILFSILRLLLFHKAFMSLFTTIGVAWYLIHFFFHRMVKRLFISVLNISW